MKNYFLSYYLKMIILKPEKLLPTGGCVMIPPEGLIDALEAVFVVDGNFPMEKS